MDGKYALCVRGIQDLGSWVKVLSSWSHHFGFEVGRVGVGVAKRVTFLDEKSAAQEEEEEEVEEEGKEEVVEEEEEGEEDEEEAWRKRKRRNII